MLSRIYLSFILSGLIFSSAQAQTGEKEDTLAVSFEIRYNWLVVPGDSCKTIKITTLNWSKNDVSCVWIINGKDTLDPKDDSPDFMVSPGEQSIRIIAQGKDGIEYTHDEKLVVECDSAQHFYLTPPYRGCGSQPDFSIITDSTISETEMRIFDRWGEFIFETTNVNMGWDGTRQNKNGETSLVQQGTYFIAFFYTDKNKVKRYYFGHISVYR